MITIKKDQQNKDIVTERMLNRKYKRSLLLFVKLLSFFQNHGATSFSFMYALHELVFEQTSNVALNSFVINAQKSIYIEIFHINYTILPKIFDS